MSAEWKVKNLAVVNLDPMLIEVAEWVKAQFGLEMITSAYRPGDPGVHGYFRGLDLRCRARERGKAIAAAINEEFIYDPDRPWMKVAIYHDVGKGVHLHLQVCDQTIRREEHEQTLEVGEG